MMELKVFDEYSEELKSFQDWIKTQPSLPQNISNFYPNSSFHCLKTKFFGSESISESK